MEGYAVPAYTKPHSKILSWAFPMIYLPTRKVELISDLGYIAPVIRNVVRKYKQVEEVVMKTDLRGYAESFKAHVMGDAYIDVPIAEFVREASEGKVLGEVSKGGNLLEDSGMELIDAIFESLDKDLRPVIATPLQWLIYSPSEFLLTRMCWVVEVKGPIRVRPYGSRNVMLEVGEVGLDKVNTPSLKALKRSILIKQRINDYWRRRIAMEVAQEELEGLGLEQFKEGEASGEAGGRVTEVE